MASLSDLLYRLKDLAGNKLRDHETAAAVNALNDAVKAIADEGVGSGGGTMNHASLNNRDVADQHPMSAITGLDTALAGKQKAITQSASAPASPEVGDLWIQV